MAPGVSVCLCMHSVLLKVQNNGRALGCASAYSHCQRLLAVRGAGAVLHAAC